MTSPDSASNHGNGRPLRVFLASDAPFLGGAEVAIERLAQGLIAAGHEVLLAVGHKGPVLDRFRDLKLPCVHAPMPLTDKWKVVQYLWSRLRLTGLMTRFRPDIVHSNDLPTHQIVSDAARRLPVPRICHHRWIFPRDGIDWLNKFGAHRHLFVSKALMEMLCAESAKLAASSRAVVHDGLPLPAAPTDLARRQARADLGLGQDKMLVLFAGQIIERKGVADLLRAWSEIQARHAKRADLVIAGDDLAGKGAYRAEMEKLARDLGSSARFVGFQKDVARWLIACDMAVVPSHEEPLGNATLEAMAQARPVIGSNVGGIPEMIADGETGLLVPPKDPPALAEAIESLLVDPTRCISLGDAGRRRCERLFSLEAHTESVLREYRGLLSDPG